MHDFDYINCLCTIADMRLELHKEKPTPSEENSVYKAMMPWSKMMLTRFHTCGVRHTSRDPFS